MKIVIIEDHKLVCDMLAHSCRSLFASAKIGVADTGARGLVLCRHEQPDLVFLDLVLPDGDGLNLLPGITAGSPRSKIIALTSFADEFTVHRALGARVDGFLAKNEQPLDTLKEAIEAVMSGGRYYSPVVRKLKASLRSDPKSFDKLLSPQEQRLLGLFGEGLTNEEVATRTSLSTNTVKVHRRNIHFKLGIHSAPELMNYALKKGFTRAAQSRS